MRRLMLVGALMLGPLACLAATPGFVGALDLDAPVLALRVTPDARVAVALVGPSGGRPGGLRVIDGSDPAKPVLKGSLAGLSGSLALSPDGWQALVAVQAEPAQQRNIATRWQVVTVDLSDPGRPREARRQELQAREVVLAGNGQAFAAVQPAPGGTARWQTTVQWAAGDRKPIVLERADGSDGGTFWLSYEARFLARMPSDHALEITSLQGAEPATHEQADVFLHRHGCIPAVLDSGHVVVDDQRMPRLGFYAAAPEVPRVATLAADGAAWCRRLDANLGPGQLVLADALDRVARIDAADASNPVSKGPWILPPRTVPLAATAQYLYAATAAPARLLVFRWDAAAPAAVDWSALDAAHRVALVQYRQFMRPGSAARRAPAPDVMRSLEEAGVLPALEAPVEGVTRQRAAEILNDYGFWARHGLGRAALVQKALRRAAELDPGRAIARLNLADWLVGELPRLTDPKVRQASMAEIDALYRRYLGLGGRAAHVRPYLQAAAQARLGSGSACEAIASHANAGRLQDLVANSATGVAMGGQRLDLAFTTEGTAHAPAVYAFDAATDRQVELELFEEHSLWGGDLLGLVTHEEGAHVLHYRDFRHPVRTFSFGDGPRCAFRATTVERVGPKAKEPALCQALNRGEGPDDLEFTEEPSLVEPTWRDNGSATTYSAGFMEPIDLANDGKPVNVVGISHDSTAGPGCTGRYFDVLDADGERLDTGPLHKLITDLQDGPWCGNNPRFFQHDGKTYFESRPATWPPQDDADRYHRVARIERGRVIDVCDFRIESRISVDR
jgi:hypothetical protein